MSEGAIPDPAVPQELYDEHYYLQLAEGHEEFTAGGVAGRYAWALKELELPEGGTLLDIGCGRGELVFWALEHGAGRAIGIEYAEAAIRIARGAAAARGFGDRAELLAADARAIPLPDASVDAVAMLDVIEHLTFAEQLEALRESLRLLTPGGRFVLHTFPNRAIYETYSRLRRVVARRPRLAARPAQARSSTRCTSASSPAPSSRSSCALPASPGIDVGYMPWVYDDHFPSERAKAAFRRIAAFGPTEHLAKASLVATATAPG